MLLSILLMLVALHQTVLGDGSILDDGFSGTAAVLQAVACIQQSSVFPADNGMLRRIAYVETRDGTRENDNIWAVSAEALQLTQNTNHPTLNVKHNFISQELGIEWISVELTDLRQPLICGIAARLLLFIAPEKIPDSNDIEGQARFWQQYYNMSGTIDEFTRASNELEGICFVLGNNNFTHKY